MSIDFLVSMGISLVLTAIKAAVKNPDKVKLEKAAFLKVYTAIKTLYADDPDFQ